MNVHNKLESFSHKVMEEAAEKSRLMMSEIDSEFLTAVEEAKKQEMQKSEHELQAAVYKAEQARNRETAAAGAAVRKELFARRNDMIKELFKGVEGRLMDFVTSAEYTDYMITAIKNLSQQYPGLSIRLRPADMCHAQAITEATGVSVQAGDEFSGGFLAYVNDGRGLLDYSFRSRLERERELFNINID